MSNPEPISADAQRLEFLVARWEAKADELEASAENIRSQMTGLCATTMEKARAYRACVADIRRYAQPRNGSPLDAVMLPTC